MSSVLFDVPGPRARTRQRLATVLVGLALLGLAWLVVDRLTEEAFTAENIEALFQPNNMEAIGEGLVGTLTAAGIAIVTSLVFGLVFASLRLSDRAVVRWPAWVVVEFFRAVPLLMLILVIFYSPFTDVVGDDYRALGALVLGLTLYNGSVLAEVFRAGVNAVPKGQVEAAYAVGLSRGQVLRLIQTPQAVRIMLPAIISQCVVILKDTSLGFVIAYDEVIRQGDLVRQFIDAGLLTYVFLAVIFIVINYSLSKLATWLERRLARRGAPVVHQAEGEAVG